MSMAALAAEDLVRAAPFAIRRLRISLHGALAEPGLRRAAGIAVTLGLSGILDEADHRRVAWALDLQRRMMAIRLAGRSLVAFLPDRDLAVTAERLWLMPDRLRAAGFGGDGRLVAMAERVRAD